MIVRWLSHVCRAGSDAYSEMIYLLFHCMSHQCTWSKSKFPYLTLNNASISVSCLFESKDDGVITR